VGTLIEGLSAEKVLGMTTTTRFVKESDGVSWFVRQPNWTLDH
jgi:hypothetical protein